MKKIKVYTVDAFTDQPFKGNPAGVVPDASTLTSEDMQLIASELNLSETAFIQKDNNMNQYRIRYFTPSSEIDFCGHATLAAGWVLATNEVIDHLALVAKIGVIDLQVNRGEVNELINITMQQAPVQVRPFVEGEIIPSLIGVNSTDIDEQLPIVLAYTGNWHLLVPIISRNKLVNAKPDYEALKYHNSRQKITTTHLYTFDTESEDINLCTRDFAPAVGINEDPVTGSANGALIGYLVKSGRLQPNVDYKIKQVNSMNRIGELAVVAYDEEEEVKVLVKGKAVIMLDATLSI